MVTKAELQDEIDALKAENADLRAGSVQELTEFVAVTATQDNVRTSRGKINKGQSKPLPLDEAASLEDQGRAVVS